MSELVAAALDRIAARPPLLLALDFDGTLAPLQDDPERSRMSPAAAGALAELAARPDLVRVALVSGRALADLYRLASPPEGTVLIGSHGAERARVSGHGLDRQDIRLDDAQAARLTELAARMQAVARGRDGVWVETKPAAAVLHTRLADSAIRAAAEAEALEIGAELGSAVLHGKNVVEVSVLTADKGSAITALRAELGAGAVLYAGDDVTDEHALAVLGADDLGVKVGEGDTAARYRVADPDALTAVLVGLAERLPGNG
ncbi:trehalose-phosphatase [Cellulomonas denverensis]|uniref:Trehalose 6-phosphate phosphatase n=1 Tax=Cellulomonas denverensis TaxID=264297 RepID=A0A7X6KV78_9CELL|nr:trehalose-phosphatase [Cellulomonas denverensis]NKY22917.1 trehalose-phosphatase [Cellulomonas denverensis]GIG24009.1 trehalose 6-phosphate phosphatase [Cellulomonas denverensis]